MKSLTHECSVVGCGRLLTAHELMCRRHWKLLTYATRAEVHSAWESWRWGAITADQLKEVQDRATGEAEARLAMGGAA